MCERFKIKSDNSTSLRQPGGSVLAPRVSVGIKPHHSLKSLRKLAIVAGSFTNNEWDTDTSHDFMEAS
jgi:hypothetical protein